MTSRLRKFSLDEIELVFEAIDRHLQVPATLIVLGGCAAAIHGSSFSTKDVDTREPLSLGLERAIQAAIHELGVPLVIAPATVADLPWNAEDRLVRFRPDLERLQIHVLERHDLALSKSLRAYDTDFEQLREVHRAQPFQLTILVERYRYEMTHVMGDPERLRSNFLDLISDLFGELARVAAERALR